MATKLITPPDAEPVSLEEAKAHLRMEIPDDDALITVLIQAAREYVERFTGRQFVVATWEHTWDVFPSVIKLPKPPLQSVVEVAYTDVGGNPQIIPATDYIVDAHSEPGRIVPAVGKTWPQTCPIPNTVRIRFEAGYGPPETVPAAIKATIKLLVGHLYENREAVITGRTAAKLPFAVNSMLWSYRVLRV